MHYSNNELYSDELIFDIVISTEFLITYRWEFEVLDHRDDLVKKMFPDNRNLLLYHKNRNPDNRGAILNMKCFINPSIDCMDYRNRGKSRTHCIFFLSFNL